ncbi:restriction endonuclease subunit S [Enterococcus asini]|uniref:Restriction endonuclease subunit S n=1 Tax=Enterococcus asini TaxID=57732 RepID=A0AAW8TUN8_9ENTE|nr:restriction endonuclease subunit S [Enterococcus asini]MDT2809638.1 restriction endonuclease subunit S [Enterococcus asini]
MVFNWEQRKLSDVANHRGGTAIEKYFDDNGPYKVISIGSYGLDSKYVDQNIRALSNDTTDGRVVHSGELTMVLNDKTANGTIIGRSLLIEQDNEYVINQRTEIVSPKENLNADFAYTVLNGPFREKVKRIVQGGTQIYVNYPAVERLILELPNIDEQKKIGDFFKNLDTTIALHQQKYDQLIQLKKAYLDLMFPKTGESTPQVRFADFHDNWEQRKVFHYGEKTYGGGTPKTSIKEFWNGELPWIQSSDLSNHQVYNVNVRKKITSIGLEKSAAKLIPKNSIAIVTRVGVGKVALIPFNYTTSQDFLSLSNLKINKWFAVYSLYKKMQKEVNTVQGTSIKGITKEELLQKNIRIPISVTEQSRIGNFLKSLDWTITLHQKKIASLKSLKQAYLQKMFV